MARQLIRSQRKSYKHYDWVPVEEDMPPDDPKCPQQSIVVMVKMRTNRKARLAFYDNRTKAWYNPKSLRPYKNNDVIAWTNDIDEEDWNCDGLL